MSDNDIQAQVERKRQEPGKLGMMLLRFGAGWGVGVMGYLFVAVFSGMLDGMPSFIAVPVIAAMTSGEVVVVCLVAGLVLWLPGVRRIWYGSVIPATVAGVVGAGLLVYSLAPGQMFEVKDDSGETYNQIGYTFTYGYGLLVFAVTNFPFGILLKRENGGNVRRKRRGI